MSFSHDFGEILIEEEPARFAPIITIGMSPFFKTIYVDGIYAI